MSLLLVSSYVLLKYTFDNDRSLFISRGLYLHTTLRVSTKDTFLAVGTFLVLVEIFYQITAWSLHPNRLHLSNCGRGTLDTIGTSVLVY